MRLLPWRPRWRNPGWTDTGGFDVGGADDLGVGLLLGLFVLALPLLVVLVVLSVEVLALLVVLPFLMAGQLLGRLPWVLVVRTADGQRRAVEVRGTRAMLDARRYYRSLRAV
ncbi:MAG TPA: hypothetical protein VM097_06800 [Mycobacteriales bacterium]|nr:hypothetical protein [Mycobacteriales bacterium]